jgi:hypothetical protein
LSLGGPADKSAAKIHTIARGGAACVRASSPVGVEVSDDVGGGCGLEKKTGGCSATDVPKYALDDGEMTVARVMHVHARFLHDIG